MEKVDYHGFQLSRYAADLAEREGIDVGLIKRLLEMSPRDRINYAQEPILVSHWFSEAGKKLRKSKKPEL